MSINFCLELIEFKSYRSKNSLTITIVPLFNPFNPFNPLDPLDPFNPLDPFEPKPYKPVYTGTYQPKTQTKTKKELPKEDDPWADFEEGEMMGDWKFSKERGWYHVGEENGGKNDDYYDYYNY